MLTLILGLAILGVPELEVQGLRAGETTALVAPAPEPARADGERLEDLHGRIVDAHTALPVAGAEVELWTEEIDERAGGFRRFHVARTGRDGRFVVPRSLGTHMAEKARITAPGYLPRSATAGDLSDVQPLFKPGDEPVVVRVVDTDGLPIVGARFTTTYSCSHDVPAFHAETGPDGYAVLDGYGPSDQVPELRLSAPGFGYVEYLWDDDSALASRRAAPFVAMLPRVRPVDVRVLDRAGRPAGGVALRLVAGDGEHVRWTDHAGRVRFESHAALEGTLYVIGGLGDGRRDSTPKLDVGYLATLDRFLPFPVTVRPEGELEGEVPEQAGGGASRLVVERPAGRADFEIRGQVLHEDGWYATWTLDDEALRSDPIPVPPDGGLTLTWGGAFSGVEFGSVDLEPSPDATLVVAIEPEREGSVFVETPLAWIQAGGETLFDVRGARGEELAQVFTPSGDRVLGPDEGRATAPAQDVGLRVLGARSDELRVVGSAHAALVRSAEGGPDAALLAGPAETELLVELRRAGYARTWTRWVLPSASATNAPPLVLEPVPLASLELRGESGFEVEGLDTDELTALHPGPLDIVVRFADGARYAIGLELEPGEERVLTLAP